MTCQLETITQKRFDRNADGTLDLYSSIDCALAGVQSIVDLFACDEVGIEKAPDMRRIAYVASVGLLEAREMLDMFAKQQSKGEVL